MHSCLIVSECLIFDPNAPNQSLTFWGTFSNEDSRKLNRDMKFRFCNLDISIQQLIEQNLVVGRLKAESLMPINKFFVNFIYPAHET